MLVQMARLGGARTIIGLTGSAAKLPIVQSLGADQAINYKLEGWAEYLAEETGGIGAEVVFDALGGDVAQTLVLGLAQRGHFVSYGAASGRLLTVDERLMGALIFGCRTLSGFALYALLSDDIVREEIVELFGLLETGAIKPIIGGSYAFDEAVDAHKIIEAGGTVGKIMLRVD